MIKLYSSQYLLSISMLFLIFSYTFYTLNQTILVYFINFNSIVQRVQQMSHENLKKDCLEFPDDDKLSLSAYVQSRKRRIRKGITGASKIQADKISMLEQKFNGLTKSEDLCKRSTSNAGDLTSSINFESVGIVGKTNQSMAKNYLKKQVSVLFESQALSKKIDQISLQDENEIKKRLQLYYQRMQADEQREIVTMRGVENTVFPNFRQQIDNQYQYQSHRLLRPKNRQFGMKFKQIDDLPQTIHMGTSLGKQNQCQICLQDVKDGQSQTFLFCFHGFHSKCIKHWLVNCVSCPICKMNVQEQMKNALEFGENE